MSKYWRSLSDEQQAELDCGPREPDYENFDVCGYEQDDNQGYSVLELSYFTINEEKVIHALIHKDPNMAWVPNAPEYKSDIYSAMWKIIRECEARNYAISAEIMRLNKRKDGFKQYINKAKECLIEQFERDGKRRYDTAFYTISLRRNPASVGVVDVGKLDDRFIRTKREPDRASILKHFKETGEVIEGVEIEQNKQSIVIK